MNKTAYSTVDYIARRNVRIGIYMKRFWHKLAMVVMIAVLSVGFSVTAFAYDEAEITGILEEYLQFWNESDFQAVLDSDTLNEEMVEKVTGWRDLKASLGELNEIKGVAVTDDGKTVYGLLTAVYTNGDLALSIDFDMEAIESVGVAYSVVNIDAYAGSENSGAPNMAKAGMNTLMGMGIVFIALFLMAWIFSLIKYIPGIIEKLTAPKKAASEEISLSVNNAVSTISEREENLVDDSELVAVITGAIMAATANQGTAGGLVVRSIRRRR